MSLYVLDTDSLSLFERRHPLLTAKIESTPPEDLAVTIITVKEQLNGWLGLLSRIRNPDEEARIHRRLAETPPLIIRLVVRSGPMYVFSVI